MKSATLAVAFAAALSVSAVSAQTINSTPPPRPCAPASTETVHSFVIKNASAPSDANEMYTALRNLLPPENKSYLVSSQNTIFVCGTPDQIALAQKMLNEMDKPKKTYRLIYDVAEMEGTRKINSQRYSIVAIAGQTTTLKQGSKVPVPSGAQFTYVDVGMNFIVGVDELANGVRLSSSVEQSSVAEDAANNPIHQPVIRQTSLKGSSFLTPGKPMMLGSVDLPGTAHRLDIQVTLDPLP
jgi:hypothetical protein